MRLLEEVLERLVEETATVGLAMGRVEGVVGGPGGVEVEGASGSRAILLHFLFLHKKRLTLEAIRRLLTSLFESLNVLK